MRPAVAFVVQMARALKVPAAANPVFEVAVSEAFTNAVKYGHNGQPNDVIICELELTSSQLLLRVLDSGRGFVVPPPEPPNVNPAEPQSLPESGYGLPIIQSIFPAIRTIRVLGRFGIELSVPLL